MTLPTREMGSVKLLVTWAKNGQWEPDIEPLRGTRFGEQLSKVPQSALDHALNGYSKPLSDALGIRPEGALRKIPEPSRVCARRTKCPLYAARECMPTAKAMPWCFEPDGCSEAVSQAAARVIAEWRDEVYVVVIEETNAVR